MPLRHALKCIFDYHIGLGEGLGDIAAFDVHRHCNIVGLVIMHQRGAVLHRFFGVEDPGQRFPIDLDQIDGLFGDIGIYGRDCGDFFANVTSLSDRKNILIGKKRAPGSFDSIFSGDHGAHAANFFRLAGVDAADPRMRERAAQHFADKHIGKKNIRDEFRITSDLVEPFDSLNAPADDRELFCFCHRLRSRYNFLRTLRAILVTASLTSILSLGIDALGCAQGAHSPLCD